MRDGSPLELALAIAGGLVPELEPTGDAIVFLRSDGTPAVRYAGLYAYDATGARLPARLALRDGGFAIEVDDSTAVYPIVVDPFVQLAKLTAADGAAGDDFGGSVSIDNGTMVIGAVNDDGSGSAYVFVGSENVWTQQAKLTASDGAANDSFGVSVGVSGDTIVVGAKLDDDSGLDSGSAYVFVRTGSTWSQQAKLLAGDGALDDNFGEAVAIAGDIVVVGVPLDDHNGGGNAGAAYVFQRDLGGAANWGQRKKLTASEADPTENFGAAVSLDGDTLAVGAPAHDGSKGAVYVFERGLGGGRQLGPEEDTFF
jgi:hypothetical protein